MTNPGESDATDELRLKDFYCSDRTGIGRKKLGGVKVRASSQFDALKRDTALTRHVNHEMATFSSPGSVNSPGEVIFPG